ncbi:MAG: DUF1993 domain-containing protein [Phenylobacterium sp.]|uniref:DUF1993 domain-containing protein n=1 Tax=Phenylobacterium sp. TaxID=1871053 RepID=UPI00271E9C0F|nr:DUF1993 domain-containing protein [Phenylobacterium sp.]MDO8899748.1 DUF1993 domain-containing protein [Phenylobacterium sp.]MDP2215605.1 DUF1993 domain-containing protein [Phenylobacterium sp.]
MALTLYDAAIPTYVQMLRNLAALLDKAEAHAKAKGQPLSDLLEARLAPDMHSLIGQIQLATDAAKGGAARLAGVTPPVMPDTETTYEDLKARVAKTLAFVETITPDQVSDDLERIIELPLPKGAMTFTAKDFVLTFSIPNFLFHVSMAYALLRHTGAPIGKLDYLAGGRASA